MAHEDVAPVITIIIIASVLLVGFAIIAPLAEVSPGFEEPAVRDAATLEGAGVWVAFDDASGTNETVWKTTGYAVNLTGADDSFVESDSGIDIAQDNDWTVSLWGRVDQASSAANMTALSIDGELVVTYNGTAGNWSVWYYEAGSRDSYTANVSTSGNEVGNFTNVQVVNNGTHLTIYRNNTAGETVNVTASSVADAPVNATNWDGRIEEVRTFDDALDATNRSALVNSPVDGQPDLNRTARIMFDQPSRSTQLILFSSAKLTQSNATFSAGFPAEEMADTMVGGDYDWRENGPQIRPVAGGDLEDAPVAYANYTREEHQDDTIELIGQAFIIGGVIVIVLLVAVVLRVLRDL